MIYFTTFIFTLLLAHITRAVPACGDAASPEDLYDPTYDDVQQPFRPFPNATKYPVTWSNFYNNPDGDTKTVVCSKLAEQFPHFKDLHRFPYIGGSFTISNSSSFDCGKCWELYNTKTDIAIFLLVIDQIDPTASGFNISEMALKKLNAGRVVPSLEILAKPCLVG